MIERLKELKPHIAGEEVYARLEAEIDLFRRHSSCYGYAFFVLRR